MAVPRITASTADMTPIVIKIDVTGVALSQIEAQKLASSIQCSIQYQLGVEEERVTVEITADGASEAAPAPNSAAARAAFAEQAVQAAAKMEGM